jgi:outer membrane protein assembly factor BamD (BamD/ComL family)
MQNNSQTSRQKRFKIPSWGIFATIVVFLFCAFHPFSQYQFALYRDTTCNYERFLARFPSSNYTAPARERLQILKEDEAWKNVTKNQGISLLRKYQKKYPNGKYSGQALREINDLAEKRWQQISKTESRLELLEFTKDFPESTKIEATKKRLIALANSKWDLIAKTNSRNEILRFQLDYPENTKSSEIYARRIAIADAKWETIAQSGSVSTLRDFLKFNPETTKAKDVNTRIAALADSEWTTFSTSRSPQEIKKFLADYPETSMKEAAEKRINELYDDIEWVKEQDSLVDYNRFLSRNPMHPQREWVEKRVVDMEVMAIADDEHDKLSPSQPLRIGGQVTTMEIENATVYELTVRYSGPGSKKITIPKLTTKTLTILPGEYKVAASVIATNVRNYYGIDTILGGHYSTKFYIKTGLEEMFSPSAKTK